MSPANSINTFPSGSVFRFRRLCPALFLFRAPRNMVFVTPAPRCVNAGGFIVHHAVWYRIVVSYKKIGFEHFLPFRYELFKSYYSDSSWNNQYKQGILIDNVSHFVTVQTSLCILRLPRYDFLYRIVPGGIALGGHLCHLRLHHPGISQIFLSDNSPIPAEFIHKGDSRRNVDVNNFLQCQLFQIQDQGPDGIAVGGNQNPVSDRSTSVQPVKRFSLFQMLSPCRTSTSFINRTLRFPAPPKTPIYPTVSACSPGNTIRSTDGKAMWHMRSLGNTNLRKKAPTKWQGPSSYVIYMVS